VPVNFLDNHDLPRFLFDATDPSSSAPRLYLLTWDGIPCVYYGTEQAFAGGVDPKNREDMWRGNPALGLPGLRHQNPAFARPRADRAAQGRAALRRGT
jgi:alpha-amylase